MNGTRSDLIPQTEQDKRFTITSFPCIQTKHGSVRDSREALHTFTAADLSSGQTTRRETRGLRGTNK